MWNLIYCLFLVVSFSTLHFGTVAAVTTEDDSGYDNTVEKKKNIPVEPPEAAALHFRYNYNGEHPVIRAFVSDRPKYLRKKADIPASERMDESEMYHRKKADIPVSEKMDESEMYHREKADIPSSERMQEYETLHPRIENRVSKRFDLYPKWYSQRIPTMFGRTFAKTYFHPFTRKRVSSRDHIARIARHRSPLNGGLHELPMSWLEPHHQHTIHMTGEKSLTGVMGGGVMGRNAMGGNVMGGNAIDGGVIDGGVIGENVMSGGVMGGNPMFAPHIGRNAMLAASHTGEILPPQLGGPVPEVVDLPDETLHQHGMRAIPYELMNRLNPNFYEPTPGNYFLYSLCVYLRNEMKFEFQHPKKCETARRFSCFDVK